MKDFQHKLIENAKKGICPVCKKQKKDHSREMLEHCRKTFNRKIYGDKGIDDISIFRPIKGKLK